MARTLSPQKRATLFSAALKLFVKKGVMNTSTAEIAKEAGVAAGTLFLYFPTKQDLLDQLVLKIGKDQSHYINQLLDPSLAARQTFSIIWHGTVSWFLENIPGLYRLRQSRSLANSSFTTTPLSKKGWLRAASNRIPLA
ncbi:MAG: helix-turn-helix domain-containing protein [Anaerolineaceae bacterium]|jgi:AcrR family transcriptional regulator